MKELAEKLITDNLNDKLKTDMVKWQKTLNQKFPEKSQQLLLTSEEEERIKLKQDAMKRMMLLIGSGDMTVAGNVLKEGEIIAGARKASKNNLPVASYMSGHDARVYMGFNPGKGEKVLNWVTSGNPKSNTNIHQKRYFTPGNRESELQGTKIMFDRHAGTHGAKIVNDTVVEKKGMMYGLRAMAGRVLNTLTFGMFLPAHSPHLGINIPFGGEGNNYDSIKGVQIRGDGTSGHAYFNINSSVWGDTIGFSLEGTAPRTEGALGAHSNTGGKDKFTAGENEKYFLKFDLKDKNFISYMESLKVSLNDDNQKIVDKYLKAVEADNERNFFDKLFNRNSELANIDSEELIKTAGLYILPDQKGKPTLVSTVLGKQLLEEGILVPYNYNGKTISFSRSSVLLDKVMQVQLKEIPEEIMYFKPQADLAKFLAQAPIFKNIEEKPLLRDNPQLSLAECYMFAMLYDIKKQENISKNLKQSLGIILQTFEDPALSKAFADFLEKNELRYKPLINDESMLFFNKFLKEELTDLKGINSNDIDIAGLLLQKVYEKSKTFLNIQSSYDYNITEAVKNYAKDYVTALANNYNRNRDSSVDANNKTLPLLRSAAKDFEELLDRPEVKLVFDEKTLSGYKSEITTFRESLENQVSNSKEKQKEYAKLIQGIKEDATSEDKSTSYMKRFAQRIASAHDNANLQNKDKDDQTKHTPKKQHTSFQEEISNATNFTRTRT